MPVNLPTLTTRDASYGVLQSIKLLQEALNILEHRKGVDPREIASMRAQLADQQRLIAQLQQQASAALAEARAQAGGGGGGGGATGLDVPLADLSDIVVAYAAANPAQLANSCLTQGGNWDFMEGCVAALMAADSRVGWCGQRGDPNDAAEDAICYWGKSTLPPINGETGNYVVDIIAGHCGADPHPAWNSVTPAGAVWLAVRP